MPTDTVATKTSGPAMETAQTGALPGLLTAPLARYVAAIEALFPGSVTGIYVQGSIALGAFDERSSDVDLVTVLARPLQKEELRALATLHRAAGGLGAWARRLDALYLSRDAAAGPQAAPPAGPRSDSPASGAHLVFRKGRAKKAERITAVARLLIRDHGIVLAGEPAHDIFAPPEPGSLRAEMDFNLNVYWRGRTARPWVFLATEMVDFAVSTLPRIVHTLETGAIVSKPRAVALLAAALPARHALVEEVRARMERCPAPRPALGRVRRAGETLRFIGETIVDANERFGLGGAC